MASGRETVPWQSARPPVSELRSSRRKSNGHEEDSNDGKKAIRSASIVQIVGALGANILGLPVE